MINIPETGGCTGPGRIKLGLSNEQRKTIIHLFLQTALIRTTDLRPSQANLPDRDPLVESDGGVWTDREV